MIATIIIICMINNCEGIAKYGMNRYIKNLNKAIYNICNKEAYNITNNTEIYNCLKVNNTRNCINLENFTEYNNIRFICINKNNADIGSGIFITIIIWIILSFSFR